MSLNSEQSGKYQDAIDIRGHMRAFSAGFRPLVENWLQTLQQAHKDKLNIVIIDTSRMEIPWEMIELTTPYEYIGTIATVTRWQPQTQTTGSTNTTINIHPQTHQGSVLYYLDDQPRHYIEQEHKILQTIQTEQCATLEILEDHLYKRLDHFGLIYLGCHGEEGRSLQKQYPSTLTANRLRVIDAHKEARPIAFINACESARVIRGDPHDNSSFVDVMLQNLASGYIGTLAKVGQREASTIARDFIVQGKAGNGATIAQVLRNMRRAATKELHQLRNLPPRNTQKMDCEYKFLYTFLYVYYGNPLACLKLTPRSAPRIVDVAISSQTIEEQTCNN